MTVVITGEGIGPTGDAGPPGPSDSGLIMLLHVNAEGYSGGVVNAMGGVTVRLPDQADGFGHIFHIGVNDLSGVTALD
jgi:hypothetical protein